MQHKKLQHWKKCNMEIMQFCQSATKNSVTKKRATWKKHKAKKIQHGKIYKSEIWKKVHNNSALEYRNGHPLKDRYLLVFCEWKRNVIILADNYLDRLDIIPCQY